MTIPQLPTPNPATVGLRPMVACIMPTADRPQFVPGAIACFLAQTWPYKRLLILDDGRQPVRHLAPEGIEYFQDAVPGRSSIWEKRNRLCDLAEGADLIAHWDDDDWSAPERLEIQVQRLKESGKAVTGFRTLLFQKDRELWRYVTKVPYALGTSLMYRRDWWAAHRFKPQGDEIGEDNVFVKAARDAAQFDCMPAGGLMVARVHAGNTSKKSIPGTAVDYWKRTSREAEFGLL